MKRALWFLVLTVGLGLLACTVSMAQAYDPYSADELDNLLAPVALYPDPLLAQILPAATYPDQIAEAQELLQGSVDPGLIDNQNWDVSVKAVAHYPEVLGMLHDDQDWTTGLGQAFVEQQADVFAAVQRLRTRAWQAGNLRTTPQQRVIVQDDGNILIVPAEPRRIYVPRYHPQAVYLAAEPGSSDAVIAFFAGLAIGAWLDRDCDWHAHRVYYHGWRGPAWVVASRPYIVLNPIYVGPRFQRDVIVVDRRIIARPIPTFRERIVVAARANRSVYLEGRRPAEGPFVSVRRTTPHVNRPPVRSNVTGRVTHQPRVPGATVRVPRQPGTSGHATRLPVTPGATVHTPRLPAATDTTGRVARRSASPRATDGTSQHSATTGSTHWRPGSVGRTTGTAAGSSANRSSRTARTGARTSPTPRVTTPRPSNVTRPTPSSRSSATADRSGARRTSPRAATKATQSRDSASQGQKDEKQTREGK